MHPEEPVTQPAPHQRQPAYDAVYAVIRSSPPRSADDYGQAAENARVWRAVEAALDAMEATAKANESEEWIVRTTLPDGTLSHFTGMGLLTEETARAVASQLNGQHGIRSEAVRRRITEEPA